MTAKVLWVRTDWLDNLGLELPETVEDMRNIAEAFHNSGSGRQRC